MSHEHERIEAFGWIQRMATLAPLKHDRSLYYPMKAYSQESEGYCRISSFFSVPWQCRVQDFFGDFFFWHILWQKNPRNPVWHWDLLVSILDFLTLPMSAID